MHTNTMKKIHQFNKVSKVNMQSATIIITHHE